MHYARNTNVIGKVVKMPTAVSVKRSHASEQTAPHVAQHGEPSGTEHAKSDDNKASTH